MADKFDALFDIPIDITFSGEKGDKGDSVKGDKGDPGEDGKSIKGDKGDPGKDGEAIKGDKGDPGRDGEDGENGESIKGDKGDDGLSAYEIWLQDGNEGDEEEFLKSLKGRDAKTPQYHGNAYTELKELEDVALSPQLVKGNLIAFNGTKWVEVPPAPSLDHYLAPNPLTDSGLAWQERGFSYLTDEAGNILTDEADNALEGKDTIDANLLVNDKPTLVEVTFADSPVTLTRPDNGKMIVNVDCTDGLPIIILYPKVQFDEISIKKTDLSGNDKLTYRGNGFNIDDLSERDISTQYNTDALVGGALQWERR